MVTKKIRTEYMKRFRDPKWETFSKCYEDCVKYRLSRRVMEHSHRPWLWDGWDSRSDSSGCSTPRRSSNKVAPLSLPPPASSETNPRGSGTGPEGEEPEEVAVVDAQAAGEQAPPPPSLEAAKTFCSPSQSWTTAWTTLQRFWIAVHHLRTRRRTPDPLRRDPQTESLQTRQQGGAIAGVPRRPSRARTAPYANPPEPRANRPSAARRSRGPRDTQRSAGHPGGRPGVFTFTFHLFKKSRNVKNE